MVVLNGRAPWALLVMMIGCIGCMFSFAEPTLAQTTDQSAAGQESSKASGDAQAADQPATVKVESSNPFSGDPEAIQSGHKLYFTWCVQCHGKKADGKSMRWGGYAKDLRKFWQGYSKFVLIVVQGVKGKQMPPWGEVLSGNEISHIGAYLETLAMDGANWK
ncbi:MAG: hypothetical protein ETSY1_00515 [Candidatus Entotheonella factor]|uniref:Cytochrome c domain-containing protein n=1 Tax=Entotheonella factor TaxID=1429438 RepID=W4LZ01_ENTF1|nr:c-type cytochrome [Candidatus Entotheonella palauensis]ETX03294.1 MAG: hypothetical protein ETSY1_00515 [Candidatus Entotheonella factor]